MVHAIKRITKKESVAVLGTMTKRQARAYLEKVLPSQFKSKRVRNIVRRTLSKTKAKEFVVAIDAVLESVDRIHDLSEQLTAMNPAFFQAQHDGTLARELNATVGQLCVKWSTVTKLV